MWPHLSSSYLKDIEQENQKEEEGAKNHFDGSANGFYRQNMNIVVEFQYMINLIS